MRYETIGDCLIITMDKELDHHIAEDIRKKADEYIMRRRARNILFDFRNTEFMDSSGIGAIMGRYRLADSVGGRVGIVNTNSNIDRIVLLSGLHKVVHTYGSFNEAIKELKEES